MSYKVNIRKAIRRRIVAWNLPDTVFVEILLRLEQQLSHNPPRHLERLQRPFDGMVYKFDLVDPSNRFLEHKFAFHIVYGQDEETLQVVNASYRLFGL